MDLVLKLSQQLLYEKKKNTSTTITCFRNKREESVRGPHGDNLKKKKKSQTQGVECQQVSFVFYQPFTTAPWCQTQRDWIIALERSRAISYRDTLGRAFVTLSEPFKSRIMGFFLSLSFYLARQPSKWKVFLTFSIIAAFNSPTVSHLPSFHSIFLVLCLSAKTSIYISSDNRGAWFCLMCWGAFLMSQSGIRDVRRHLWAARFNF